MHFNKPFVFTVQQKVLSGYNSYFLCIKDQYSQANRSGFVILGVSINQKVMKHIKQYLPPFFIGQDLKYAEPTGADFLNKLLAKGTPYVEGQISTISNINAVLAVVTACRRISSTGVFHDLSTILEYAESSQVQYNESNCHLVFTKDRKMVEEALQNKKMTFIILNSLEDMVQTTNVNIFYVYQHKFLENVKCASVYGKDMKNLKKSVHFDNLQLSTSIAAKIRQIFNCQSDKKVEQLTQQEQNQIYENYKADLIEMIKLEQKSEIDPRNIHLGIGATGCLQNCSFNIFNKDDIVTIEAPFYNMYIPDFEKCHVKIDFVDLYKGTLLQRVEESQKKGRKGFIITNPHNPTGLVFKFHQIQPVCEYVSKHPNFHLIFDEVYLNSTAEKIDLRSACQYASKFENIHVARSFGKDYGLCGLKMGFLISCNQKIKQNWQRWRRIIHPQTYNCSIISQVLKKSNYGQDIYSFARDGIASASRLAYSLLDEEKIDYLKGEGGCFLILDLRRFLKQPTSECQEQLWRILFYKYRLFFSMGAQYKFREPGFFRVCHIVKDQLLEEGIRRLIQFVRGQAPTFDSQ